MEPYAGFEPQVGEIRAVRTFRIGPGGGLYPLFSNTPWEDGTNAASCRMHQSSAGAAPRHRAPAPDCTCGFYSYGAEQAACEYPYAHDVLAVVACWGGVIAGTRGVRAEFCRVEALWLSDSVPSELAAAVARRYPSVELHCDKAAMLAAHPLTQLDCYERAMPRRRPSAQRWLYGAVGGALVLSVLPTRFWAGGGNVEILWVAAFGIFVVAALLTGFGKSADMGLRRRRLLLQALALWMIAPLAGPLGTLLLRIPLVQLTILLLTQHYRLRRDARRFPAVIDGT